MTDTVDHSRGPFTALTPIQVPPEMDRFMTAMRRLQDLAVSADPDDTVLAEANGPDGRAAPPSLVTPI